MWELRSSTDLSPVAESGQAAWFTEGCDTKEGLDAKVLLVEVG
jgi:hypothetical protein